LKQLRNKRLLTDLQGLIALLQLFSVNPARAIFTGLPGSGNTSEEFSKSKKKRLRSITINLIIKLNPNLILFKASFIKDNISETNMTSWKVFGM